MKERSTEQLQQSTVNTSTEYPVQNLTKSRLDWVDYAKGLCIIMVVMMHSTHDVANVVGREGFMYYLVAFARPFRMPDFFLISGLFLSQVINRNWRTFLDRKVIHFVYFYAIWVTIMFGMKLPGILREEGIASAVLLYLEMFIQPPGTLWFIYVLPIFFIITRLLKNVHPLLVFVVAAILQVATIETGWTIIDQSTERFVFFYTGYWLAPKVFSLAAWAQQKTRKALFGVGIWAALNSLLVFGGYSYSPFINLVLGFVGAAAIVTVAALLAKHGIGGVLRYCGKNSIVVYLSFFIPMIITRIILLETRLVPSVGATALIVSAAGVVVPLITWRVIRNTRFSFLFRRPAYFSLDKPKQETSVLQVAGTV